MIRSVGELNLGFSDAQNYNQRRNKQMLSDVFVKNSYLEDLLKTHVYFLIGEKGTGKTAYATFLSNSEYKGNKSLLRYINTTDYEKFYELKKMGRIDVSGYVDIWKAILLLLLAKSVTENDRFPVPVRKPVFNQLIKAIDEYYDNAFSPEIINAFKIVDNSKLAAKLFCKYAEVGGKENSTLEFSEQRLQMNLYYICQQFAEGIKSLKLKKDITLFVDGIDVRPSQIPYTDYLECIKGLTNAAWILNTDLFANVRDTNGHFRIVLLLRPDIFNSLNLQNATNKLADNSVYLEWRTTYANYRKSNLYQMGNKLLSYGQDLKDCSSIWEQYFDWKLPSTKPEEREYDTAFIEFLKISLSRPRDIQRILKLLQDIMKQEGIADKVNFDIGVYNSDTFQNNYSEYFLSSLKDQLSFYYSEDDYQHFIKFFDFFCKPTFTHKEYLAAYEQYTEYIINNAEDIPKFVEDPKLFLQLLYDSNVIAVIDNKTKYYHFSYREKNPTNIAPKVVCSDEVTYRFHYGLYKKAKMGRY